MFTHELNTNNPRIKLIKPDLERDASLSVEWLAGDNGRRTLKLMGVPDSQNKPSDLKDEIKRVSDFLNIKDQLNWMISFDGAVIGSVWVDLKSSEYLKSPSVSIMIGNNTVRGQGIGYESLSSVIDYLKNESYAEVFARRIEENIASHKVMKKLGFKESGVLYSDKDGIAWQNYSLKLI